MERKMDVVALAALMLAIVFMVAACGTFGNGKLDLPYDVSVSVVLPSGEHLAVALTEDGVQISGRYVSPKTGIIYEVDPDGTITATDALGNQIMLSPRNK